MDFDQRQRAHESIQPAMGVEDEIDISIDLVELFYRLLENVKYIVLAGALALAISMIYTFVIVTPMYESTSKLYVLNSNDSAVNLADLQIGTYLASDYQEVFKTWEVHEQVIANLNLDMTYRELSDMLTVTNPNNTRILYISIQSSDPLQATTIANEYAAVVSEFISKTMATEQPNILSKAIQPTVPISPNKTLNLIIGVMLGALIAIGVITVRFVMDDKIKSSEDILRYTGLPTLSVVPVFDQDNKPNGAQQSKAKKGKR